MNYRCPVCFYERMPYPPEDYNICPCCGTEFGNDDVEYSYEELRLNWLMKGAHWFYEQPPVGWSAGAQLAKAAYGLNTEGGSARNTLYIRDFRPERDLELQLA